MLPRWLSYAIGDFATWIAWRAMPSTTSALIDNLRAIFPDESAPALSRRARQTLGCYARDTVDFLRALELGDDDARALFVYEPEDAEVFRRLLAEGRGAILVTGHYGNWELGGVAMSRVFKLPLTVIVMAEASEEVNQQRRRIRDAMGVDTIEVRQALDTALQIRRRLAENKIVALLMDRHLGRDRVAVTFLGRRTWFLRTPALMAHLSGAALVPCFIERKGAGRFSIRAGTQIVVDLALPRDEALARAAQEFATQLEARVREHPEYWYHFYRYWAAQHDSYDSLT